MLINITKKIVIVFIIGVLVGAIVATAGFLIFSKTSKLDRNCPAPPSFSQSENSGMPGMNREDKQAESQKSDKTSKSQKDNVGKTQGENQNEQPPEMPGSDNSANSN